MKNFNKNMRKVISILLALTMVFSLTSCKKSEGCNGKNTDKVELGNEPTKVSDSEKNKANNLLAKQNVYSFNEIDLSSVPFTTDNQYLESASLVNGDLYCVYSGNTYNDSYSKSEYIIVVIGTDGKIKSTKELVSFENDISDVPIVYEESFEDSSMFEEAYYEEPEVSEPIDFMRDYDGEEVEDYSYEYFGMYNFAFGSDGSLYAQGYHSVDSCTDGEYVYEYDQYVCGYDTDGNEFMHVVLEEDDNDDDYSYLQKILPSKDGAILVYSGDSSYFVPIDKSGNFGDMVKISNNGKEISYFENISIDSKDNVFISYYSDDWESKYYSKVDLKTGKITMSVELPESVRNDSYNMCAGEFHDIIYSSSLGLCYYNLGDDFGNVLMNASNSNMYDGNYNNILELTEDMFFANFYDYHDGMNKYGLFTHIKPEDIPDKNIIVIGGLYIDDNLSNLAIELNQKSDFYKYIVRDYKVYNTDDDYELGQTTLKNEILAGEGPDILYFSDTSLANEFATKGLLMSIDAIMEADSEINPEDYLQNVFDAYRIKEKLYYVFPSFSIQTFAGKKSLFGNKDRMSLGEVNQIAKQISPDTVVFSDYERSWFFTTALEYMGNDFVDMSTGKCNFNSDEFIELLEFSKTIPEVLGDDYYNEDYYNNYQTRYLEDNVLLSNVYMYDIKNLTETFNGTFAGDCMLTGFPTKNNNGGIFSCYNMYAISSKTEYIDASWNLLKSVLDVDYQKKLTYTIPVNKEAFEIHIKEATEQDYYLNSAGEKIYNDYYYWNGNDSIIIDPLNEEQVKEIEDYVMNITSAGFENSDIQNIIVEEADAFFSGQKSAADVAGIIQNRVQIYVDENR